MARPKHLKGDARDGFVNFRIPPDLDEDVTILCFLMGLAGSTVCVQAVREFCNRYREQIDAIKTVWHQVKDQIQDHLPPEDGQEERDG